MSTISVKLFFVFCFVGSLSGSEPNVQPGAQPGAAPGSVIYSFLERRQNAAPPTAIIVRPLLEPTRPLVSLLEGFSQQLYRPNQPSNATSGASSLADDTPGKPGGLNALLATLSNLPSRPLSDQSASSGTAGVIGGGIAAVQQSFSQVGSTVQNGFNSVFGVNQGNDVSPSNQLGPVSSAAGGFGSFASSKPSFCPSNCTMICGKPSSSVRIVGGADVSPANKYPWVALIQYYGRNIGTGTLVNDRVVLTSATVVSSMVVFKQIRAIFGAFDASLPTEGSRTESTVTKARVHPQYAADKPFRYNIGFLQLAVPVAITDRFMPICLPGNVDTFADTDGTLAGWGARERGGESWKTLREASIPLYSLDECRLAYPNSTEDNLCGGIFDPAPADQHRTSCDGDGGTGLMYPWKTDPSLMTLVGVALQIPGVGCARTNEPALFTKVYKYIPWVQSQAAGCYCKS